MPAKEVHRGPSRDSMYILTIQAMVQTVSAEKITLQSDPIVSWSMKETTGTTIVKELRKDEGSSVQRQEI
jgi:hypothetical protein